jgi:anti-sigma B factor antagonist
VNDEGPARPSTPGTTDEHLSTTDGDRAIVVTVAGDVDYATAPRVQAAVLQALHRLQDRLLVLDLTRVRFFGTAGISTLVETIRAAGQAEKYPALRIVVNNSRPVIRPIQISGLDGLLALYPTIEDALAA